MFPFLPDPPAPQRLSHVSRPLLQSSPTPTHISSPSVVGVKEKTVKDGKQKKSPLFIPSLVLSCLRPHTNCLPSLWELVLEDMGREREKWGSSSSNYIFIPLLVVRERRLEISSKDYGSLSFIKHKRVLKGRHTIRDKVVSSPRTQVFEEKRGTLKETRSVNFCW